MTMEQAETVKLEIETALINENARLRAELAALRERVGELEEIAETFRKVLNEELIELHYFGQMESATRDWIEDVLATAQPETAEGGE